ncbi:MAG: hypothetical protein Q9228_005333, partial [Teloschistes exilis]
MLLAWLRGFTASASMSFQTLGRLDDPRELPIPSIMSLVRVLVFQSPTCPLSIL